MHVSLAAMFKKCQKVILSLDPQVEGCRGACAASIAHVLEASFNNVKVQSKLTYRQADITHIHEYIGFHQKTQ